MSLYADNIIFFNKSYCEVCGIKKLENSLAAIWRSKQMRRRIWKIVGNFLLNLTEVMWEKKLKCLIRGGIKITKYVQHPQGKLVGSK